MFASTFGQDYWQAALDYWRDPKTRSWILVNPGSLGDTWCTLLLLDAFRKAHGGPLTLVLRQSHADLAEPFSHLIDRLILWDDERLLRFCLRLRGCGHFGIDEPIIAHPIWHGTAQNLFPLMELLRHPGRGGVTFIDQWRLMLRLPWSSPLGAVALPKAWREEAKAEARAAGLVEGRSVVLFPDNNTNPPLPDPFWSALARALAAEGWTVFCNMAGNNRGPRSQAIEGAAPIRVTARNAIGLVGTAGRFISMANGMQALLMSAGAARSHSFLIANTGAGQDWGGLGSTVRDPMIQSFHTVGLARGPFCEFVVDPDHINPDLILAIARNDPARMAAFEIAAEA
jgi:hypothetical protein